MKFDKQSERAMSIVLILVGLVLAFGQKIINIPETSFTTITGIIVLGIGLWLLFKNA